MTTKVTGLTGLNVKALRDTHADAIASGNLRLTATTAVWQVSPSAALANLDGKMIGLPRGRHPRQSLHAVRRKLARLVEQEVQA